MFSTIRIKGLLLFLALSSVSFPALSAIVEHSTTNSVQPEKTLISQNIKKPLYRRILDIIGGRRESNGTRDDNFCSIWPDKDRTDSLLTWSDRPLFAWKGSATQIEIYDSEWNLVWKRDVQNVQYLTYPDNESALRRGEDYTYRISYQYQREDGKIIATNKDHPFQVLNLEQFSSLQEGLAALDNQIQNLSDEEKALERAKYFAQQDILLRENSKPQKLWADVFLELFTVSSPEWTDIISQIRSDELCNSNPNNHSTNVSN
ncbi:MAG TPA: hypothetical protein DCL61_10570 [Cyanobacteria bacterium UBA12227]|nr:hypothetical protein [Cyanobacteria bacterium UBA12227]HAX87157.1 hypothetical protein [Cyanobacteria bacterium UBA11370]HBY80963.1 hypothetical protein [Cyanobacteria bacterium UBA11148]